MAGTIDLLPTIVSLAGGKVASERAIDGHDITPLLLSKATESTREAHYYFLNYQLQAVRQGPWKLALVKQPEAMSGAAPQDTEVNPRLYNLSKEIGERTNVADKHPEIVTRLQALASKMAAEIGEASRPRVAPAGTSPTRCLVSDDDRSEDKSESFKASEFGPT